MTDAKQPVAPNEETVTKTSWLKTVLYFLVLSVFAYQTFDYIRSKFYVADCDESRAKDAVKDLLVENKIDVDSFLSAVSTKSERVETTCVAVVKIKDGSKLKVDYKMFLKDMDTMVQLQNAEVAQ